MTPSSLKVAVTIGGLSLAASPALRPAWPAAVVLCRMDGVRSPSSGHSLSVQPKTLFHGLAAHLSAPTASVCDVSRVYHGLDERLIV